MVEEKKYELKTQPKKLGNLKIEIPKESDQWSPDYFYCAFKRLKELQGLDLRTREGSEKFYSLVDGEYIKNWDSSSVQKAHKNLVSTVTNGLVQNSLRNIGWLTGLLDDETALGLALSFPGFYTDSLTKTYIDAARSVTHFQEVSADIKNAQDKYLERRFDGLNEESKTFWASLSKEILRADQLIAQRRAFEAMQNFGSPKSYLATNIATAKRLADDYSQAQEELNKKIKEALKKKLIEKGGHLTHLEQIKFEKEFEGRQKEFAERYKQGIIASEVIQKIFDEVMDAAYQQIEKQKEKEKRKNQK